MRAQSFASASCAASRASSGSRSKLAGELLHARRVPLAERLECARVAVFRSFHQNRIAQPRVDERPFRTEGLLDWTAARRAAVASVAL